MSKSTFIFQEDLTEEEEQQFEEEKGQTLRGGDSICVANTIERRLNVVLTMTTVKKTGSTERGFNAGFGAGGFNFGVSQKNVCLKTNMILIHYICR